MVLELYGGSGSPFSWRVLLTLEVKQLKYESKILEFSKQENRSPAYLKLNPRARVPTLRDGDFVLYESLAIMAYLEAKYPEPPIFGRTPQETGTIWRLISEHDSYLREPAFKVIRPLYFGGVSEKREEILAAAKTVHEELARLEAALSKFPWLAGDAISAADIAVFPGIQSLLRAASKEEAKPLDLGFLPLSERYPNLAAWMKRVEGIPGYERTYPPHWRQ